MRSLGLGQLEGEFGVEIAERIRRMPSDRQAYAIGFVRDELARGRRQFGLGDLTSDRDAIRKDLASKLTGAVAGNWGTSQEALRFLKSKGFPITVKTSLVGSTTYSYFGDRGVLDAYMKLSAMIIPAVVAAWNRIDGVVFADAQADLMGRSWDYNKELQAKKSAEANAAIEKLRQAVMSGAVPPKYPGGAALKKWIYGIPGVTRPSLAWHAGKVFIPVAPVLDATVDIPYPKSPSNLLSDPTWKSIAKGVTKGAAAMVSMVAAGPIGAVAIMATAGAAEMAQERAESAAQKEWNNAVYAQIEAEKLAAEGGAAAPSGTMKPEEATAKDTTSPILYGALAVGGALLLLGKKIL
jgi:hypothetical protein